MFEVEDEILIWISGFNYNYKHQFLFYLDLVSIFKRGLRFLFCLNFKVYIKSIAQISFWKNYIICLGLQKKKITLLFEFDANYINF